MDAGDTECGPTAGSVLPYLRDHRRKLTLIGEDNVINRQLEPERFEDSSRYIETSDIHSADICDSMSSLGSDARFLPLLPSPIPQIKQGPDALGSIVPQRPVYAFVPTPLKPADQAGPQAATQNPPELGRSLPAS